MRKWIILPILVVGALIASCERQPVDLGDAGFKFGRGVFVVNEGQFLAANASVSFIDPEADSVYNHIFFQANQVPLGDVANSMSIWQDDAYIVVNNSGKVYRASRYDMNYKGKLTGLVSPRYIAPVDSCEIVLDSGLHLLLLSRL